MKRAAKDQRRRNGIGVHREDVPLAALHAHVVSLHAQRWRDGEIRVTRVRSRKIQSAPQFASTGLTPAAHLRSFAAGFLPKINQAKRTT
jgi:hypothetical protein